MNSRRPTDTSAASGNRPLTASRAAEPRKLPTKDGSADDGLDRRRFLVLGSAAATLGTAVATDWSDCPADGRFPAWHPDCSGFHGNRQLIVRLELDACSFQQTVLTGLEARLWRLCAGDLSERQLVERVRGEWPGARARGGEPEVDRAVGRFLQGMYKSGYLLPLRAEAAVADRVREVVYPPGLAGPLARAALAGRDAHPRPRSP